VESTFIYLSAPIINIHCSHKCSGQFHIAEGDRKDRNKGNDVLSDKEGSRKVDAKGSEDDATESGDEEVISPASYVAIYVACGDTDHNI
jgi:hypothetical protein